MSYDARGFGWVRVKKADEREIAYVLEESGFEVGRRTDEPGTGFVRVEVEYPYVDYYASGEMEKAFGDVAE